MTTADSNARIRTRTETGTRTGASIGAITESRTDAINSCRLMDTVLSTPSFHQSLFTDSVQLFPDHILQEARHHHESASQKQQDLNTFMTDLLSLVEQTRLEINEALLKNPAWKTVSPSLEMNTITLSSFDNASHQLVRTMQAFQKSYRQSNSSQNLLEYHQHQQQQQRYSSNFSSEQDTVPGLGEASRALRSTQEALLNMMSNIRTVQETISLLTDPASQTKKAIAQIQQELIRGSGDPGVEAYLDRLYTMSATFERALQRK
ncbi:MAG: hypothetical protein J3R72DRAFT_452117 [Linnemannia gamsii]|nr:MAG: hypothetical protein J3R72DRAFT_452117 [Linnemannia gamsii]